MRPIVSWATRNAPAMNVLMLAALTVGIVSMVRMRRESFPEFELDIILVTVPYPGASPEEVEKGICQKIEEAVRSVDGIKRQTAVAREGSGSLVLELETGANAQRVLNEVRSEVDSIPSFPELAEEPDIKELTYRIPAIRVGVIAEESDDPSAPRRLREVAELVRDDLLLLPSVSQASILGAPDYQIDIEIPEARLREHGLTLQQVAHIIRRQNVELPGGIMKSRGQDVLLRGKNRQDVGAEIGKLPVLNDPSGDVLTVSDLGNVRDEFTDEYFVCQIDGKPGLVISVNRTRSEDLLKMAEEVRTFVSNHELPGYELCYWSDDSVDVQDRVEMLVHNGLQGLTLVFLLLAIFLDLRLAFWVALGIPVAVLGAGAVLHYTGQTLNMLSMFGFLMGLGMVVDDAIVIGENVALHRAMDKDTVRAAIDGTCEVLPSVFSSVGTTIVAFVPLMFVAGVMGKFFAVMPLAVIAMLTISLIEATIVLPCHLSHVDSWIFRFFRIVFFPVRVLGDMFQTLNRWSDRFLGFMIERTYVPTAKWAFRRPGLILSGAIAILLFLGGLILAGIIPFVAFPKLDTRSIAAHLSFPDGTPGEITDQATRKLAESFMTVNARLGGSLASHHYRRVGWATRGIGPESLTGSMRGGHVGMVCVELVAPEERTVHSERIVEEWRREWSERFADQYPGIDSLVFAGEEMGPGGQPIEFKLLSRSDDESFRQLEEAVEQCKKRLADFDGVIDIEDDSRPGKWEYQIRVKEDAKAMGVTVADLSETVRASYYGDEVMRLQRGRHEVKLMVRYPPEERRSLAAFNNIRVRMNDGEERPLTELADVQVARGYAEVNRLDQRRCITISADVQGAANAHKIVQTLRAGFVPGLLDRHPGVTVRWEGQQETTQEAMESLKFGFAVAVLGMYVMLALEVRSYLQPLLILAIVPFGFIGAVIGHVIMGLEFTLLSVFGMTALTGVVVNDSIVLIDFINHRLEAGRPLHEALTEAGSRRLRPIILTSVTTIGGLAPMLLENSVQGQVLVPMATSVAFGLMASTALVLLLVPVMYALYAQFAGVRSALETAERPVP